MPNVIYAECHNCSLLSVVMLHVILLNVVASTIKVYNVDTAGEE
jgi:hypothetical protein